MAVFRVKVLARYQTRNGSHAGELVWEWILRADGQVCYRLSAVNGQADRNPWQPVAQLPDADLRAVRRDRPKAEALLAAVARQQGHQPR